MRYYLGISVIISTLIFSASYIWINRYDFTSHKTYGEGLDVIIITNKITGEYCLFLPKTILQRTIKPGISKDEVRLSGTPICQYEFPSGEWDLRRSIKLP